MLYQYGTASSSNSASRSWCTARNRRPRSRPAWALLAVAWTLGAVNAQSESAATAAASAASPLLPARWGQASALMDNLFVVQGGKTQGDGGGYTYGSAPNSGDMFVLDLAAPFNTSSPPWRAVNVTADGSAAPAVSFHTLSPLASRELLLFGGDGSPVVPIQTRNDSAYTAQLSGSGDNYSVRYTPVDPSWQEPMRRIYHAAESDTDGCLWLIGGQKADGSGLLLDELWTLNSTSGGNVFELSQSRPPGSIAGASSTLLSDGTLLMLGGLDSNGQLQSMEEIITFSTNTGAWGRTATAAAASGISRRADDPATVAPQPRRGHVAVSLPNRRVFVQGGANADLSVVYSDAWLLDWSVNPPVWTQLNSTGGPGPRYGHAAVAYGRQVVTTFGWSGGNAADDSVYVFDGTSMTSADSGSWSGGGWASTYQPDPEAAASSTGQGASTGSSPSGNGSSSSTGGGQPGSPSDTDGSTPTQSGFPTAEPEPTAKSSGGTSDGAKAGAAVGALIGVGLVVGAGYAIYRQRSAHHNWRRGDGAAGLLGRGGYPDDDFFMLEKTSLPYSNERPYDGDRYSGGAAAAAQLGGAGRRTSERRAEASPWTAGNIGHAMEGSGPHFRERIAILTGRRQTGGANQPRFDMLADEEDGQSYRGGPGGQGPRDAYAYLEDEDEEDEVDAADREAWQGDHLKEESQPGRGHAQDLSIGDIGRGVEAYEADDDYVTSPFEDGAGRRAAPYSAGLLSGAGAALLGKRAYERLSNDGHRQAEDDDDDSDGEDGRGPASDARHSAQSHTNTTRSTNSGTVSSAKSQDPFSPGGFVSFSDAAHGAGGRSGLISPLGPRTSPSPLMRRSPTWWDRFMNNSFLERSASGRLLSGPGAEVPIRDPAQPPELDMIAESPANFGDAPDDEDPFRDAAASAEQQHMKRGSTYAGGLDEMGRRVNDGSEDGSPFSSYQHGRSLSSLNSNRTATSSMLEYQLRNMQVVQRVRTGSSRRSGSTRTGSSSDAESMAALSRGPSMLRPRNLGPLDENESTPGSVVWRPEHWAAAGATEEEGEEDEAEEQLRSPSPSPVVAQSPFDGEVEAIASPLESKASLRSSPTKDTRRTQMASETPSITPATTKRARLNPLLTSPLRPEPPKASHTVLSGSVRDRVKAIEEQDPGATLLPSSPSSKAWSATLGAASMSSFGAESSATTSVGHTSTNTAATSPSSERKGPILSSEPLLSPAGEGRETKLSPTAHRSKSKAGVKYSHGLVPKAQLFVANPDDRRTSSGSS